MQTDLLLESFREHWRWLTWWCAAVAVFVFVNLAFYPSIRDSSGLATYAEHLPKAMRALFVGGELDLTSAVGFLNSQIYALPAPIIFTIFAVGGGAGAIAGEEEQGSLDLLLAQPVSRTRVLVERFCWLGLSTLLLTAVLAATAIIGSGIFGLQVGASKVIAASVSTGFFGLLFGAIAFAVGGVAPGKARAVSVAAAVASAAWILDGVSKTVNWLESFQILSPYHQAFGGSPLVNGPVWGDWAILLVMITVTIAVAIAGIGRRDIRQ